MFTCCLKLFGVIFEREPFAETRGSHLGTSHLGTKPFGDEAIWGRAIWGRTFFGTFEPFGDVQFGDVPVFAHFEGRFSPLVFYAGDRTDRKAEPC